MIEGPLKLYLQISEIQQLNERVRLPLPHAKDNDPPVADTGYAYAHTPPQNDDDTSHEDDARSSIASPTLSHRSTPTSPSSIDSQPIQLVPLVRVSYWTSNIFKLENSDTDSESDSELPIN